MQLELPWDEPTKTNKEYLDWLNNKVNRTPWIKMDSQSLGMHGCCFLHSLLDAGQHVYSVHAEGEVYK